MPDRGTGPSTWIPRPARVHEHPARPQALVRWMGEHAVLRLPEPEATDHVHGWRHLLGRLATLAPQADIGRPP